MIALIVRVKIVSHRVFGPKPVINPLELRNYLIRIPESGPNRREVQPIMSDEEAVEYLLKKLKSVHGTKRVYLDKVYRTDDPNLLDAPQNP